MTHRAAPPSPEEMLERVRWIIHEQSGIALEKVRPASRLVQDLGMDSLELVELFMTLEETFAVTLPDKECQECFTKLPATVEVLSRLVLERWGTGEPDRSEWQRPRSILVEKSAALFRQLGFPAPGKPASISDLHVPDGTNPEGFPVYRRRTDGMPCVLVPGARPWIGYAASDALPDQQPIHRAALDAFLIDAEPVSNLAYALFLNETGITDPALVREWFGTEEWDRRLTYAPLRYEVNRWVPLPGTDQQPIILVSWFGANAYSLWANCRDWRYYRGDGTMPPAFEQVTGAAAPPDKTGNWSFLPSEAQWEYAARGAEPRLYPWGDREPDDSLAVTGLHRARAGYAPGDLPMASVSAKLGMSPFGLHHMAGNIWQWCCDWYAPDFYGTGAATRVNPVNGMPTGVRSERGGSWVSPARLSRSSYRRARPPQARGRCLGFRCMGSPRDLPST